MKIKDLLQAKKINEGPVDLLKNLGLGLAASTSTFGDTATKSLVSGRRTKTVRQEFNNYLKASNQQATSDSLIKFLKAAGWPTDSAREIIAKAYPQAATQPVDQTVNQPAGQASSDQSATQSSDQTTAAGADKSTTDYYEKVKGQMRQVQSGSTPLPQKTEKTKKDIADIKADITKLSQGDKESGSRAAQKILSLANRGYDVEDLITDWNAKSKFGERFLTQSVFIPVSKMLEQYNLTWQDLGIKLRLDESVKGGLYISMLNENQAVLSDKVINQAINAAVLDAYDHKSDKEKENRSIVLPRTTDNSNINDIKSQIDTSDEKTKQQIIDYLSNSVTNTGQT